MEKRKRAAIREMKKVAEEIYNDLEGKRIPELEVPSRTKSNIEFDERHGVWKYGSNVTTRSATSLSGAQMLLRTIYTI
ncbi:MAG: DNA topoisomerase VI, partial [Candidatus Thermoplasmatota archaeon]|nr:DNA topoisomerase VI [Candidatus Thermoplasmatota archaeon]